MVSPAGAVGVSLNGGSTLAETETMVGRPREEKADFWTSVGGQYKASIDYVVQTTVESGATFVRGPEVRTQTIRTQISDGPARTLTELHRIGGRVRDAAGEPLRDAWVAVPEAGRWAVTDADGRFRFDRMRPGSHRAIARTASGEETEATLEVPGASADLVIGTRRKK